MAKHYPESKVELNGLIAKNYDGIMNSLSLGWYKKFLKNAIKSIDIQPKDTIADFGAGTGRNALLMHEFLSNKGSILGLEISEEMRLQFDRKTKNIENVKAINQRIDIPFNLDQKFDKILISFVFHGFPHEVRETIIKNAYNLLKDDGEFIILDFNEFVLENTPFYFRIPFKTIECKYAFDFIAKNWKNILQDFGFHDFEETLFGKNYVRLLKARKTGVVPINQDMKK